MNFLKYLLIYHFILINGALAGDEETEHRKYSRKDILEAFCAVKDKKKLFLTPLQNKVFLKQVLYCGGVMTICCLFDNKNFFLEKMEKSSYFNNILDFLNKNEKIFKGICCGSRFIHKFWSEASDANEKLLSIEFIKKNG